MTKRIPRSRLYEQLGHRSGESIPALRQGRGCAAWLLFLRAVPARSSPSAIAFQHGSRLTGHLPAASPEGHASGQRGDAESSRRKPPSKPCRSTLLHAWGGHIPPGQPAGHIDFLYCYCSSLGSCCTIYSGLAKEHAPGLERKMAILSF